MNKNMEQAKNIYQSIEVPTQLNERVNTAIDKALNSKQKRSLVWFKPISISLATVCLIFVILLNTSQAFAETAYDIPIIGSIARVFTFKKYQVSSNAYNIQVEVPVIKNTGNTDLEKRINNEIQDKIDQIVESTKQRGEMHIKDYLAGGGNEEDLIPYHIMITYEVKSSNENTLFFVINDIESSVTSYTYQTFYNIDLNTHKDITLSNKLGKDYSDIIVNNIRNKIEQSIKEHPDWSYTVTDVDLKGMVDDLKFYINEAGNVVISFDKGEIAPPPMGIQDFEIIK